MENLNYFQNTNTNLKICFPYKYYFNYTFQRVLFSKEECEYITSLGNSVDKIKQKSASEEPEFLHEKIHALKHGVNPENYFRSNINYIVPAETTNFLYDKIYRYVLELNNNYFHYDLWSFGEPAKFSEYDANYNGGTCLHQDIGLGNPFRKLTIVIQLTDENEYEGGDLKLMSNIEISDNMKKQGNVIVFPSHTWHEVKNVTRGIRNSLVLFVYGPPFK